MKNNYIFDVDGTLTPSRGKIDPDFKEWFNQFSKDNPVYLITGSDKDKTVEQIGEDTYNLATTVYNCSGNDVWQGNKQLRTNSWVLPDDARDWLNHELKISKCPLRTGLHIEERPGMVNFSTVGRNATLGERKLYVTFDTATNERLDIAKRFNETFEDLEARAGGETGIDIQPKGSDKSQIISDFGDDDILRFYGDRMDEGGNDYPLKVAIERNDMGVCYHVEDWQDTWQKLKQIV